ncbi:TPA: hypothetical protein OPR07_004498 [Citrobacter koseri]|nr:hypothetical protein [Citrobacter koseri]
MKNIIVINRVRKVVNVVVFSDGDSESAMSDLYPEHEFIDTSNILDAVYYDIGTYHNVSDGLFYVDSALTTVATRQIG